MKLIQSKDIEKRDGEKAQITLDYLAGITIFLFAIFFVFQYTSGLFTPFQSDSDEITIVADRTSLALVENMMSAGNMGTPNLVDEAKVDSFFNDLNSNYDSTIDSMGLKGSYMDYDLNVTLENETALLYSGGKALTYDNNIGQTNRVVLINATNSTDVALLSVRVW